MKIEWDEPTVQTVASWADLVVLVICLVSIILIITGVLK